MMPWIDSGKSSTSPVSVHPPSPLDQQAAILQHPHVLLRVQADCPRRAPSSACCTSAGSSAWSSSAATSRAVSSPDSGVSESVLAFVLPPAPVLPALEQLGPGRADDQQRHRAGAVSQQVDEVQQRVVGPVDVLEHQHRRAVLGECLEEPPPRRERLRPDHCSPPVECRAPPIPTKRPQVPHHPLAIPLVQDHRRDRLARASPRRHRAVVGLQDASLRLDHLAQRPERDALAVGERAAAPPRDQLRQLLDISPTAPRPAATCRSPARR